MKKALLMSLAGLAMTAAAATPAAYPGGEEELVNFIAANMQYPARAKANGIEGLVNLQVVVGADGSLTKVTVLRPLDPDLEAEAIRIVRLMPAWTPALDEGGVPVSQTVTLPVRFRIPAE